MVSPSVPPGDAPCPHCGPLLWFGPPATKVPTVLTTRQAARIGKVSRETIIRGFRAGEPKGIVVPGSKRRLIPRDCLRQFMMDNGIPTALLDEGMEQLVAITAACFTPTKRGRAQPVRQAADNPPKSVLRGRT